jgi:methylmalonyl-CoA/ethylmalonyl-CoA epimerase
MLIIDHIGIVVTDLDDGIKQWTNLFGYSQKSEPVLNSKQKVYVVFLIKADSLMVKLISPASDDSPIKVFALKGGGLHHLCFRCDNLEEEIPILQEKGARLIVAPQKGEAFNNHNIAFLLASNNINVELIDTNEKKGWVDKR